MGLRLLNPDIRLTRPGKLTDRCSHMTSDLWSFNTALINWCFKFFNRTHDRRSSRFDGWCPIWHPSRLTRHRTLRAIPTYRNTVSRKWIRAEIFIFIHNHGTVGWVVKQRSILIRRTSLDEPQETDARLRTGGRHLERPVLGTVTGADHLSGRPSCQKFSTVQWYIPRLDARWDVRHALLPLFDQPYLTLFVPVQWPQSSTS